MRVETNRTVGEIRTVAGFGDGAMSGDGGLALAACLNEPKSVSFDGHGNLLIVDSENHVVRKVDRLSGVIVTVAGCAKPLHPREATVQSDGGGASIDEDPLAEQASDQAFAHQTDLSGTVRYVINGGGLPLRFGGDGGPAVKALLNFPTAAAVDPAGHLYIADTMNHRIRRIDATSGRISTIAGVGQPRFGGDGGPAAAAGLNEPSALAVTASSILYVADQNNNRVRAIDLGTGVIKTVAGNGASGYNGDGIPAIEAALAGPSGLAVGTDGTLFIADTFNGRIRSVDPVTGLIRTVAGDGETYRYQGAAEPASASLARPYGIALDAAGNLFISDSDNHLIRRWERRTGRLDRVAGVGMAAYGGDGGSALEASLNYPFGIAVSEDGALFVADTFNHRIREIIL
jgi:DNA-binding beta-propeller fold protein YncE